MSAIIAPAKITKAKVLSIQASCKRELKSANIAYPESKREKLCKISVPKATPLKREIFTFLV